ncbi:hypothetical protein IWW39_001656 [Coemansia spiralis]|uniref:Uncharacterized protein n=1 Tax=Coemansia spiralis TaxID=417178 RepID=A0A9W8L611_9FUNG|nr:hypothetical protein IWW39_001656 [Coemansia spiralis]
MKLTAASLAILSAAASAVASVIPAASPAPLPAQANDLAAAAQDFNARAWDYYRYRRDNIPNSEQLNARGWDYYRY